MTERPFHISKLLVGALIFAATSTGALIITLLTQMPGTARPPGPDGMPPPPPETRPLAVFSVVTGIFVLAWLSTLVIYCRDQILAQPRGVSHEELTGLLAEYGERRETDGYLNGMRTAAAAPDPPEANVRALRRTPPPR